MTLILQKQHQQQHHHHQRFLPLLGKATFSTPTSTSTPSTDKDNNKTSNNKNPQERKIHKKENFAKKFLDPASKGLLNTKHGSGIPKLAIKKPKSHTVKDEYPGKETEDDIVDAFVTGVSLNVAAATNDADAANDGNDNGNGKLGSGSPPSKNKTKKATASSSSSSSKKSKDISHLFKTIQLSDLNPLTEHEFEWLGKNNNNNNSNSNSKTSNRSKLLQQRTIKRSSQQSSRNGKNYDMWGDEILQSELNDPWTTPAISTSFEHVHDESKREAKPIKYPTNRKSPNQEFIDSFSCFAFVSNLTRPVVVKHNDNADTNADGNELTLALGVYKNPLHRQEVVQQVIQLFPKLKSSNQIFVSTMNSVYIGFHDSKEASDVLQSTSTTASNQQLNRVIRYNIEYKQYTNAKELLEEQQVPNSDLQAFVQDHNGSFVVLDNLPPGMKQTTIVKSFYDALPTLQPTNVHFTSPTTAICKTSTKVQVEVDTQKMMEQCIAKLSKQIVQIYPAEIELTHDKFGGPARQFQFKKKTSNLFVQGDTPSHSFFTSHAYVLHLSNVPSTITNEVLSTYFQPYCMLDRDINGSIEHVKPLDGVTYTGRVYVGFDLESEGIKAYNDIVANHIQHKSQITNLTTCGTPIFVSPVKEKTLVRGSKLGERSYRNADELQYCLHDKWREYVSQEDMELLEKMGVPTHVLEDSFMTARFHNPSFAAEGLARVGERLNEELGPGDEFREFVEMYVESLKELGSSKENSGPMYEGMFLPEEEMEFSMFDDEKKRLDKIKSDREKIM